MSVEPDIQRIAVEPLSSESFARFGSVIRAEAMDSPNLNRAPGNLGVLWVQRALSFPGQAYLGTLRYYYRGVRCEFVQRHPESTVVLIPLGGRPSVVVAAGAAPDGSPSLSDAHAFLLDGSAGIVFHPNIWLRYAYPIGEFTDFAYITQRVDPETANTTDDTVRCNLDQEFSSVLEFAFSQPEGDEYEFGPGGVVRVGPPRRPPWE
jgi:ureidoglycolate hydrolase